VAAGSSGGAGGVLLTTRAYWPTRMMVETKKTAKRRESGLHTGGGRE
jgi:hypothetical protein